MREALLLAIATAACSTSPVRTTSGGEPMTDTPCTIALHNFVAGKLAEARLPAGCTLDGACEALDALKHAKDATGSLGSDRVQARWRAIDTGVAGERLLLWHDGEHVLAIELEAPRVANGWDALRQAIGNPDAKLPYWDGVVEAATGQWVYAARGLALYTTLADTELSRAIAFPPTSVDAYRAKLARATEPPREFE
jgi:hypothetical protein